MHGHHHMGGWHHHRHHMGWHHRGPSPLFMLPLLFIGAFMFFGLLKFLWPLLLIGLIVMVVKGSKHNWGDPARWERMRDEWRGWYQDGEKRKNDNTIIIDKPKRRDDVTYV
jgi:hypothetical protein